MTENSKTWLILSGSCQALLITGPARLRYYRISRYTQNSAITEAREYSLKDQTIRHWPVFHGAAYIQVNDTTLPTPYLSHTLCRNIVILQMYECQAEQLAIIDTSLTE